jgi:hypothetical protein
MSDKPPIAFERKPVTLPLAQIRPLRLLKKDNKYMPRYEKIRSSIRLLGIIEPLIVYRQSAGRYLLMDGHQRYYALQEFGIKTVKCLVTIENESYTYNARVNRLNPMQEHKMIAKVIADGVPPERVAEALCIDRSHLQRRLNLLKGIDPRAAEKLKDSPITANALRIFRQVKPERQVAMAELMVMVNDFTRPYAQVLLATTPGDLLMKPRRPKTGASLEQVQKMEEATSELEKNFKILQETHANNMLLLTSTVGYVKRLLHNDKVTLFLYKHYRQIQEDFELLVKQVKSVDLTM